MSTIENTSVQITCLIPQELLSQYLAARQQLADC